VFTGVRRRKRYGECVGSLGGCGVADAPLAALGVADALMGGSTTGPPNISRSAASMVCPTRPRDPARKAPAPGSAPPAAPRARGRETRGPLEARVAPA